MLIERSIAGQKEFELEVMRDSADNCVVICSIENFDPMGVHTGDSITVAPAQTLTDVELQTMRDAAFACIRRVGVETGGSNVQFAVDPVDGRQVVIEMNPRVSRSSALASKATGFPIAKIAARLAVGYRLDEIANDITGATPASFEPTIDYVVTKIPRWAFEKLPGSTDQLGTRMQSVGEVMGIGRTFPESLQKAVRSLEQGRSGLNADPAEVGARRRADEELRPSAARATPERLFQLESLLRRGVPVERLAELTGIDPWFLSRSRRSTDARMALDLQVTLGVTVDDLDRRAWRRLKRLGFSDQQLAYLFGEPVTAGRHPGGPHRPRCRGHLQDGRHLWGRVRGAHAVPLLDHRGRGRDPALGPAAGDHPRIRPQPDRPGHRVRLLLRPRLVRTAGRRVRDGHGQLQPGDGLHRLRHLGPPLLRAAHPRGPGQRARCRARRLGRGGPAGRGHRQPRRADPLKLAAGIPEELVLGTSPSSIDLAEDRERWNALCGSLGIPQPPAGTATTAAEAVEVASSIGYPVLVRPSYVLGGRAMEIVYDDERLVEAVEAMSGVGGSLGPRGRGDGRTPGAGRPLPRGRGRGRRRRRPRRHRRGRHLRGHGARRGGRGALGRLGLRPAPPDPVRRPVVAELERMVRTIAEALQVRGLINVQFAVKDDRAYVLEANPAGQPDRPFRGQGHRGAGGHGGGPGDGRGPRWPSSAREGCSSSRSTGHVSVKEAVLPFNRFPGVDTLLGPEMRSTGEVMGIDTTFGLAFAKSQIAAGNRLPVDGTVFLSLADRDKSAGLDVARQFAALGFELAATSGTAAMLEAEGIPVGTVVAKVGDSHPGWSTPST